MISIPTRDGYVHARLIQSLIPQMAGRPLQIVAGVVPLEMARNKIAEEFMKSDCTHLAMFDADGIPPSNVIDEMLKIDEGLVTAITPIINRNGMTSNVFTHMGSKGNVLPLEEVLAKKDPFDITGVGMACVLIKREVFEKLSKPYFASLWFQANSENGGNGDFCEGDIYFSGRVLDAGFRLVAVPTLFCEHVKQFTFSKDHQVTSRPVPEWNQTAVKPE